MFSGSLYIFCKLIVKENMDHYLTLLKNTLISNCAVQPDVMIDSSGTKEDDMTNTAITFILLFLLTLVFSIGTTAFKVTQQIGVGTNLELLRLGT